MAELPGSPAPGLDWTARGNTPKTITCAWEMGGRICDLPPRHLEHIAAAVRTAAYLPPGFRAAQAQINRCYN